MTWKPPRGWRRVARTSHVAYHDAYRHDGGSSLHLLFRVEYEGTPVGLWWWRLTDSVGSRHETAEARFPGPVPFLWAGRILAGNGNR